MAPRSLQVLMTDVLVIGAGAAGLCAAIAAAPRRALVVTAASPETSTCTALAQGGIAAPIGAGDSIAEHVADTLRAACQSGADQVTRSVIARAADAIAFLEAAGVAFDHCGSEPALHLEAGHSRPRVLHAEGDRTGRAILNALVARARDCGHIDLMDGVRAASLLEATDGGIAGVLALDADSRLLAITARETVLATGGLGRLFAFTTNEAYAAGDGLAMALARGAEVAGLEFVQFHPTALCCTEDPLPLLTEALRGAGATLTGSGRPLILDRHPAGDLAPRDVVARAVWECHAGGDQVFLDARVLFASARGSEFPAALATCRSHGIDPAVQPIPVTAAAHYHMGGVMADECGRTSLAGLWACGEVACTGIHGANRLASNSLLEAIVCGRRVGEAIRRLPSVRRPWLRRNVFESLPFDERCEHWAALRRLMWKHMGPIRDGPDLAPAIRALRTTQRSLPREALILRQRYNLAAAMMIAAAAREESRGAHWRRDFPQRDAARDGAGALHFIRRRASRTAIDQPGFPSMRGWVRRCARR